MFFSRGLQDFKAIETVRSDAMCPKPEVTRDEHRPVKKFGLYHCEHDACAFVTDDREEFTEHAERGEIVQRERGAPVGGR